MNEGTVAITRDFDAPRERVFAAWTRAEHLTAWFAPRSYTVPVCELRPEPGGAFRVCMRSPEGVALAEHGGRTRLTLTVTAKGTGAAAGRMLEGMQESWARTVSRLDSQVKPGR